MTHHIATRDSPELEVRPRQPVVSAPAGPLGRLAALLPGLFLAGLIATQAFALRSLPGFSLFSPLILAIVLGMAFHNIVGTPIRAKAGVAFSLRRVLRLGVMLLGLQLTLGQLVAVGGGGLLVLVATVTATFAFTLWLGRVMGLDRRLTELVAAGTSICGASAVIATNAVTGGSDEDVAYAVACVTVFGSLSMLLYPMLPAVLALDAHAFGLWAGGSIHEVAQVVAAAFQHGVEAGELATVAKLSRVLMLVPVVVGLSWLAARRGRAQGERRAGRTPPIPWFVLGFVALVLFNSLVPMTPAILEQTAHVTTFLLAMALAAMGLETDVRKLRAKGWKPLLLGAGAWVFIAGFSLGLVKLVG